jgi:hypothetical protein
MAIRQAKATQIAVRCEREKKINSPGFLSPSHGFLQAEWVAVFCHRVGLMRLEYRQFLVFSEAGE